MCADYDGDKIVITVALYLYKMSRPLCTDRVAFCEKKKNFQNRGYKRILLNLKSKALSNKTQK
jgi:hypothetical protein